MRPGMELYGMEFLFIRTITVANTENAKPFFLLELKLFIFMNSNNNI